MSELKGTAPVLTTKRLKKFTYGPPGSGKTTEICRFPKNYIIDLEHGTDNYVNMINKSGSVVLHSNNPDEISEQLQLLLTTKHDFLSVSIDPITQLYNSIQEKWTRIFTQYTSNQKNVDLMDFGPRFWGRVKSEMKSIHRKLLALDMNVHVTSHQKDVYGGGMTKLGVAFDSMKGDDYIYDYIFRLDKEQDKYFANLEKERAEPGKRKFPDRFEWSYENFCKYYGAEVLEKKSVPVEMANAEDVETLKSLLGVLKIEDEIVQKWLTKADVDTFEEFTKAQINKSIEFLKDKLPK